MGYKKVSGAPIESWSEQGAGTVIEGKFLALRQHEGEFGLQYLADFNVNGIRRTFGCPAILRDRLSGVPQDTQVRVEYGGLKEPKKPAGRGNPHMFIVERWEEDGTDENGNEDKLPFEE